MSDNYELHKSKLPQVDDNDTPYVSKNWNFVNDINGGVYSSQGTSLVQFDLTSIYNSSQFVDVSQLYIAVPVVLASAVATSANALAAPIAGYGHAWHALKNGGWNILNGGDLIVNGQTLDQFVPNINVYTGFRMLSEMSQDDLNSYGITLGMGNKLDNFQSLRFNSSPLITGSAATAFPVLTSLTAGLVGGNGFSNNVPFTFAAAESNGGDVGTINYEYYKTHNAGLYSRMVKPVDTSVTNTATNSTNLFGPSANTNKDATTVLTSTQLSNEMKSYTSVQNTNYVVTYDTVIIRLGDIFGSIKKMPLTKRFDAQVRLYFNCGAVGSGVSGSYMCHSGSTNTFTGTCPIIQPCIGTPASYYGASVDRIVSGIGISKAPVTNVFNINLANSGAAHPMTSCRMYYPQIQLKPSIMDSYVSANRNKQIEYTSVLFNQFNGITSGSTFSQLLQSGVSRIKSLVLIPFQSSTTNGNVPAAALTGVTTFSQLQSPFDTAPMTNAPISLTQIQVSVGGTNQLYQTLNYSWENFLEQVITYEKSQGSDYGLNCGLFNQLYWENCFRAYYIDLSRGQVADQLSARNISISFNNNSNLTIDVYAFIEYYQVAELDVATGRVTKQ